jgi:hypothetical protein
MGGPQADAGELPLLADTVIWTMSPNDSTWWR